MDGGHINRGYNLNLAPSRAEEGKKAVGSKNPGQTGTIQTVMGWWALFCAGHSYGEGFGIGMSQDPACGFTLDWERMLEHGGQLKITKMICGKPRRWISGWRALTNRTGPSPAPQARFDQPGGVTPTWITKEINNLQGLLPLVHITIWKCRRKFRIACTSLTDYVCFIYIGFHVQLKELFWREEREDRIEVAIL